MLPIDGSTTPEISIRAVTVISDKSMDFRVSRFQNFFGQKLLESNK